MWHLNSVLDGHPDNTKAVKKFRKESSGANLTSAVAHTQPIKPRERHIKIQSANVCLVFIASVHFKDCNIAILTVLSPPQKCNGQC